MSQFDRERAKQQIRQFEIIKRAGEAAEDLVSLIHDTPYENLDAKIGKLLGCTLEEATMVRQLSLDRLSPFKVGLISAELEDLVRYYSDQTGSRG